MPGSGGGDDESVDSLDAWLQGGPPKKTGGGGGGNDDDDSVDQEFERILQRKAASAVEEQAAGKENTGETAGDSPALAQKKSSAACGWDSDSSSDYGKYVTGARTDAGGKMRTSHRRRGVTWHPTVDTMERKKRRLGALSKDVDDSDDDDDELLEYAREADTRRKRKQEEEADRSAAAAAAASEARQDYSDGDDDGIAPEEAEDIKKTNDSDGDIDAIEESEELLPGTPSPRKHEVIDLERSGQQDNAQSLYCVDSDGDEELDEPTHPLLSSPPPHMDASSWQAVRRLQEEDWKVAAGAASSSSPGKRKRPALDTSNDSEFARRLQAEEEAAAEAETQRQRKLITQGSTSFEDRLGTGDSSAGVSDSRRSQNFGSSSSKTPFSGAGHRLGRK